MMREPLLEESFYQPAYSSESEKSPQVKRRQFLQTVGLVGVGLALAPNIVLAQHSDFKRWRDRVNGFVYSVCEDESRARTITSQLNSTGLQWRGETTDFHYYYAAPIIFAGGMILSERVICNNGFEVKRYPFYDHQYPCQHVTDLNAFEIRCVTNPVEIKEYGCVMAPHGRRRSLEGYADHANYRRVAKTYDIDPDQFEPEYKRVFKGNKRAVIGYQIAHKTAVGTNGKPEKGVILDSSDI
ncbi:MAG TPA: twin-arginine translocation signal domain-containing protein [Pyrinomonadaceae bacterium]